LFDVFSERSYEGCCEAKSCSPHNVLHKKKTQAGLMFFLFYIIEQGNLAQDDEVILLFHNF
jgi:hypothetical protein